MLQPVGGHEELAHRLLGFGAAVRDVLVLLELLDLLELVEDYVDLLLGHRGHHQYEVRLPSVRDVDFEQGGGCPGALAGLPLGEVIVDLVLVVALGQHERGFSERQCAVTAADGGLEPLTLELLHEGGAASRAVDDHRLPLGAMAGERSADWATPTVVEIGCPS